ncbi:MAG: amidohydrolase [Desulfobacterales bacterium]|nr:amidohydrolase [Desulfobacterales bacterium]
MHTIFYNGNIIRLNPDNSRAQAMVIEGERIKAVGTDKLILALKTPDTKLIDLNGRTILPGFIDAHVHASLTGLTFGAANLSTATSVKEACKIIAEHADSVPPGKWIFGMGCSPWLLNENRFPHMEELDRATHNRPVYIFSPTMHSGAASSAAFKYIQPPPDLPGVEKDPITGKPTGSFLTDDAHFFATRRALGTLSDSDIAGLYEKVCHLAVSRGVTTMHCLDGQFFENDRDVLAHRKIKSELPIDTLLFYQTMDVDKALDLGISRIGGCLCIDGTAFEHTALYYQPYSDCPDTCGKMYFSTEQIESFVTTAHNAGMQIGMHAIGDRAVDILVNTYKKVMSDYPRSDCRHRVEHFITPSDHAIDTAIELGLVPVMQPVFPYLWDDPQHSDYEPLVGRKRAERMEPFPRLLSCGLPVVGSSDSPVTSINPLMGIHAAVNMPRQSRRVSVTDALKMYTRNGAWVGKEELQKGSIEAGKLADLVVLDRNPFDEPAEIKDFQVELTIVHGKEVYNRLLDQS